MPSASDRKIASDMGPLVLQWVEHELDNHPVHSSQENLQAAIKVHDTNIQPWTHSRSELFPTAMRKYGYQEIQYNTLDNIDGSKSRGPKCRDKNCKQHGAHCLPAFAYTHPDYECDLAKEVYDGKTILNRFGRKSPNKDLMQACYFCFTTTQPHCAVSEMPCPKLISGQEETVSGDGQAGIGMTAEEQVVNDTNQNEVGGSGQEAGLHGEGEDELESDTPMPPPSAPSRKRKALASVSPHTPKRTKAKKAEALSSRTTVTPASPSKGKSKAPANESTERSPPLGTSVGSHAKVPTTPDNESNTFGGLDEPDHATPTPMSHTSFRPSVPAAHSAAPQFASSGFGTSGFGTSAFAKPLFAAPAFVAPAPASGSASVVASGLTATSNTALSASPSGTTATSRPPALIFPPDTSATSKNPTPTTAPPGTATTTKPPTPTAPTGTTTTNVAPVVPATLSDISAKGKTPATASASQPIGFGSGQRPTWLAANKPVSPELSPADWLRSVRSLPHDISLLSSSFHAPQLPTPDTSGHSPPLERQQTSPATHLPPQNPDTSSHTPNQQSGDRQSEALSIHTALLKSLSPLTTTLAPLREMVHNTLRTIRTAENDMQSFQSELSTITLESTTRHEADRTLIDTLTRELNEKKGVLHNMDGRLLLARKEAENLRKDLKNSLEKINSLEESTATAVRDRNLAEGRHDAIIRERDEAFGQREEMQRERDKAQTTAISANARVNEAARMVEAALKEKDNMRKAMLEEERVYAGDRTQLDYATWLENKLQNGVRIPEPLAAYQQQRAAMKQRMREQHEAQVSSRIGLGSSQLSGSGMRQNVGSGMGQASASGMGQGSS